jgi:hypothetical protein
MLVPVRSLLALGVALLPPAGARAAEPAPPAPPELRLPEITGPIPPARLASTDARVETYPRPELYQPWLPAGIGAGLRLNPEAVLSFAFDAGFVWPFHIWRGDAPGFFPAAQLAYRSTGRLALSVGFGAGVLDADRYSYRDSPQALLYLPQATFELLGDDSVSAGFRHDIIFKPDAWYLGLGHVILAAPSGARHDLVLLVGADFMEAFL